jgi:hypothetical protein
VGPQGPPALRYVGLVAVTSLRAGPSYGLPGQAPEQRNWIKIQPAKSIKPGQDSTGVDSFIEVVPGGPVLWPCEAQSAAAVAFRLPTASTGTSDNGAAVPTGFGEKPQASMEPAIAAASLDGAALVALADAMADVQATVAAYGTALIFRVSVEAKGLPPAARKALRSELAKAASEFVEAG